MACSPASVSASSGLIDAPTAMIISTDGQTLYVTGRDPHTHAPVIMSFATANLAGTTLAEGGELVQPTGLGTSLDGQTLYVADAEAGPNGTAQLFSLGAGGGVTTLTALVPGGIADATHVGGGVVAGFDDGIDLAAFGGAVARVTSVPPAGGVETLRTSSTGRRRSSRRSSSRATRRASTPSTAKRPAAVAWW